MASYETSNVSLTKVYTLPQKTTESYIIILLFPYLAHKKIEQTNYYTLNILHKFIFS